MEEILNQIKALGYTIQAPKGRDNTYYFVKNFIKNKKVYTWRVYFNIKTLELEVIENQGYIQREIDLPDNDPLLILIGQLI